MPKLLITGASGLLGSNLAKIASENFDTYGTYCNNKINFVNCPCSILKMDIQEKSQVKIIENINPDLIVHCAAYVNVDGCEKNPDDAYQINVAGTENIVKESEKTGSFLIHISTDLVFDGIKGNYCEDDKTNPINIYGKTKLESEEIVKNSDCKYCIVRTNIYGWNKRNKLSLTEWMIHKLENNEKLNGFYDAIFTPIFVNNLTDVLLEIYENKICGLFHIYGSESCSKLEFAKKIANVFELNKNLVESTSIDEMDFIAKRAKNLSMRTEKIRSLVSTKLPNVEQGLSDMRILERQGYVRELKMQ